MDVRVLGALTIDEGRIAPAPRDRLVLGALVARLGKSVSVESLATALWGDDLPASWSKVIPGCIMRLRRVIAPASIETAPLGYLLVADGVDIDTVEFERLVARGSELLELGEPDRAVHALLVQLWRSGAASRSPSCPIGSRRASSRFGWTRSGLPPKSPCWKRNCSRVISATRPLRHVPGSPKHRCANVDG